MINLINYLLNDFFDEYGDSRVLQFYLMSGGPTKVILIILVYLLFVKYIGPKLMANRKPLDLRAVILIYNSILIGLNGIGFVFAFWITEKFTKTFDCSPIDKTDNFHNKIFLLFGYLYFITKLADLFDTIFFVLRKKQSHITTLHVFHHSIMPVSAWFGLKMYPSNYSSFLPVINSFVHSIMYSYYALSLSPELKEKHV